MASKVIFEIEIEATKAKEALDETTLAIKNNQDKIKDLSKSYAENVSEINTLKNANAALTSKAREYNKVLVTEKGSLNDLRNQLSKLTSERNKVNLTTEEGRKTAKNYNDQILKVTNSIKEQEQAGGDFRRSVGDYKTALSGVSPVLSGVANGIFAMTKQALAFIATPLGLVIGAIGLAISAVTRHFKDSEEGQNKWNKIVKVSEVIINNLFDILSDVGGALVSFGEALLSPIELLKTLGDVLVNNVINRFKAFGLIGNSIVKILSGDLKEGFADLGNNLLQLGTGVEGLAGKIADGFNAAVDSVKKLVDETGKEIAIAKKLADLEAKIHADERKLLVDTARLRTEIETLKLNAVDKEKFKGEERLAFLRKANALEITLAKQQEALAYDKFTLIKEQNKLSKSNEDALKAQAQAEADYLSIKGQSATKLKELTSQEIALVNELRSAREAENKAKQDAIDLDAKLLKEKNDKILDSANALAVSRAEIEANEETDSLLKIQRQIDAEKLKLDILLANDQLLSTDRIRLKEETDAKIRELDNQKTDAIIENEKKISEVRKAEAETHLITAGEIAGNLASLSEKDKNISKKFATIQALINTYQAVTKAYAQGGIYGIALAATVGAAGFAQVAKIQGFAEGGRVNGGFPIQRNNGDNVLITAKTGEVILNNRQQNLVGSEALNRAGIRGFAEGGIVGNEVARDQIRSVQSFSQMNISVSVTEINKVQNRVKVIEKTGSL